MNARPAQSRNRWRQAIEAKTMRVIKATLKFIGFCTLICLIATVVYYGFFYLTRNIKSDEVIVVEATFMQYLCGEEIDDMKIESVNLSNFNYLIGRDIDPQVLKTSKESELKGYFYDNRSAEYGLTYRLTGRLSKFNSFGCDKNAQKFWVEEIEMINGSNKMTSKEIIESLAFK